jgi:hypothetical protein
MKNMVLAPRDRAFVNVSDPWRFSESPKNGGFEGFHLKAMLEKHAKPLQGFA